MSDAITRAIDDLLDASHAFEMLDRADPAATMSHTRERYKRFTESRTALLAMIDPERIARLELLEKLEKEARSSVERFGVTPELHGINSWLAALDAQRAPDAAPGED